MTADRVEIDRSDFDRLVRLAEMSTVEGYRKFAEHLHREVSGDCAATFRDTGIRCGRPADHKEHRQPGMGGYSHEARGSSPQVFTLCWDDRLEDEDGYRGVG